KLL
ncbi:hypothetical protein AB1N83_011129, partial [Pleurotus pulmonarius]